MIDRTISHYRILEKLGEGAMGVVYQARDTRLERPVALKILPAGAMRDQERKWRFEQEAKTASGLNHPHIVTIYDIGEAEGVDFIAMEYVQGQPLDRRIPAGGLPFETALDWAVQTAEALAAAHAAGVVHRDIKPANILVSDSGQVKVLDFGLAKLMESDQGSATLAESDPAMATALAQASTLEASPRTRHGAILGTPAYMSPEQAQGKPVDARSDVFSFGAVLYEMLRGRRPFEGDSPLATLAAILRDAPPPLRTVRRDVPRELERIVRRCLEKQPEARYTSATDLAADLRRLQTQITASPVSLRSFLRTPRYVLPAVALLLALILGGGYLVWRNGRQRWAREVALPEIRQLTEKEKFVGAFQLAAHANRWAPAEVSRLRREGWLPVSVETDPGGADVFFKGYRELEAAWQHLGRSPIATTLPFGYYRWRLVRAGSEPLEAASPDPMNISFRLPRAGSLPAGMVLVPGGSQEVGVAPTVNVEDFWIDKFEVTNRQFKEFVDRGGYRDPAHWREPFVDDGRALSFEEAMSRFRDSTGRPGPATWELGTYPEGRADYPVTGVSWYEAAAYAQFAGRSLPTFYHWYRAAGIGIFSDILAFSNFGGTGPWPAGSGQGLGPYGTYDMAGNVKEWCWNASGAKRYILGGGWDEPEYMFAISDSDAQSRFARRTNFGLRCAQYSAPLEPASLAPIEQLHRDYSKEKPVGDEVFKVYRRLYSYERGPLDAKIEAVDETSPHWRKETITFIAGYGKERTKVYLFLPRDHPPPYQTVIWFPAGNAFRTRSSENLPMRPLDFVIRSGRAVMYPIYDGTYERRIEDTATASAFRDVVLHWGEDLGRSIDYIESRSDLDSHRIAYYGLSAGAGAGELLLAVEDRIRTAILAAGGLDTEPSLPEIDPLHFVPRIRIPVLMINGQNDFLRPLETSQLPMFRLLGTPGDQKRHVLLEGGHAPTRMQDFIREVLDWLDRTLGPVPTASAPSAS